MPSRSAAPDAVDAEDEASEAFGSAEPQPAVQATTASAALRHSVALHRRGLPGRGIMASRSSSCASRFLTALLSLGPVDLGQRLKPLLLVLQPHLFG